MLYGYTYVALSEAFSGAYLETPCEQNNVPVDSYFHTGEF